MLRAYKISGANKPLTLEDWDFVRVAAANDYKCDLGGVRFHIGRAAAGPDIPCKKRGSGFSSCILPGRVANRQILEV